MTGLVARLRAWSYQHTHKHGRYSPIGQAFHWGMAGLVLFQLWWGWWVGRLPAGPDKLHGYELHSHIGLALLVLVLGRMIYRLALPGPVTDADEKGWARIAAHVTHYSFYALLIALPLSGWAMWSAMAPAQPLAAAGVAPWPHLPFEHLPGRTRWLIMQWGERVHLVLALAMLGLIFAHVGAALKHHFLDRDNVLASMTPFVRPLPPRRPEGRRRSRKGRASPLPSAAD